jgi:hypothetical protein
MQQPNQNPLARVMSIVANERVQQELDLHGPQLQSFKDSFDELKDDVVSRIEELQRKPDAEKRKLRPKLFETVAGEVQEMLNTVFLPDQVERYKQLRLQKDGLGAFADSGVRETLGFDEEQMEKLRTIVMPGMKRVTAATKNGTDTEGKTVSQVHVEEVAKIIELMTDEQRAKWKELKGEPFTFDEDPAPGAAGASGGAAAGPGAQGPGRTGPVAN